MQNLSAAQADADTDNWYSAVREEKNILNVPRDPASVAANSVPPGPSMTDEIPPAVEGIWARSVAPGAPAPPGLPHARR